MTNRFVLCAAAVVMGVAGAANAVNLWDQSAINPSSAGFFNEINGSPPFGMTAYTVADVTVPATGWTINSITMYWSNLGSFWPASVTGRLYLQPKTGSVPTVVPGGSLIPMSVVDFGDHFSVTASGLSNVLTPGDYWIGITPGGGVGGELCLQSQSPAYGSPSATYGFPSAAWTGNPGGVGDVAILVTGTPTPAPSGLALLGVGGMLAARRRRK